MMPLVICSRDVIVFLLGDPEGSNGAECDIRDTGFSDLGPPFDYWT